MTSISRQQAHKRPGSSRQLTVRQMMAVISWLLTAASSFRQAPVEKFQICMHNIVSDVYSQVYTNESTTTAVVVLM